MSPSWTYSSPASAASDSHASAAALVSVKTTSPASAVLELEPVSSPEFWIVSPDSVSSGSPAAASSACAAACSAAAPSAAGTGTTQTGSSPGCSGSHYGQTRTQHLGHSMS